MKAKKFLPVLISLSVLISLITIGYMSDYDNSQLKKDKAKIVNTTAKLANKDYEIRGVWISYLELSMENEDDKSEKAFINKFKTIALNCKKNGFNTLIVQVRPFADALYKSSYYPYSHIITGIQGKNPNYDPLSIMCRICKENNLFIHAWINPYRIATNNTPSVLSEDNPYIKNKNIGIETENGIFLDPSNAEAQRLILDGVEEIIKNYDVSGIQFDDYFYPTQNKDFDEKQYNDYLNNTKNGQLSLEKWRFSNVSLLISEVYRIVHKQNSNLVFGISPQGNINNNDNLYADVRSWCKYRGFIDYICPQLYFSIENPALRFEEALNTWTELEFDEKVSLYIGLAGYKAGSDADKNTWKVAGNDILKKEYEILKNNKNIKGFMLYSYDSIINDNSIKEINNLVEAIKQN